jgi:nifR3 family TIM-barrel protein
MRHPLPFTAPWLLAPMEGVTEPCFRDLVLDHNPPGALGGAYTEFVRVVSGPVPRHVLRDHLGVPRRDRPVGLQLMGSDVAHVAASARAAADEGAPILDLNFGCPAKGALRGCAGSALLREPERLEAIVRACVDAVPELPVTGKIRAGYDDATRVEELAQAVEAGGASMLTIHCRTRAEGYQEEVDWSRIARAVRAVRIPVCGNGGATTHAELERMRRTTGCHYVMIGRGALADPWVFTGRTVTTPEAATFLLEYAERLMTNGNARTSGAAARVKQLLNYWTAGGLVAEGREGWLRERDAERLFARLRAAAAPLPQETGLLQWAPRTFGEDTPL